MPTELGTVLTSLGTAELCECDVINIDRKLIILPRALQDKRQVSLSNSVASARPSLALGSPTGVAVGINRHEGIVSDLRSDAAREACADVDTGEDAPVV